MPRFTVNQLLSRPATLAKLYLKNVGKDKLHQFYEGIVTEKLPGDSSKMKLRTQMHGGEVTLPVRYMTCNADAFDVNDRALIFAPGCNLDKSIVIGFTRDAEPCIALDATIYAITGSTPAATGVLVDFPPVGITYPIGIHEIDYPPHYREPRTSVRRGAGVYRSNGSTLARVGPANFNFTTSCNYFFELESEQLWLDAYSGVTLLRSIWSYRISKLMIGVPVNGGLDCAGMPAGTATEECDGILFNPDGPDGFPPAVTSLQTGDSVLFMHAGHPHPGVLDPFGAQHFDPILNTEFVPILTSWTEVDGDAGESTSVFYRGRKLQSQFEDPCKEVGQNFHSRPEVRSVAGARWYGNTVSMGDTDDSTTFTLEASASPDQPNGVVVYRPTAGTMTQIWTPEELEFSVKTFIGKYDEPINTPSWDDRDNNAQLHPTRVASHYTNQTCGTKIATPPEVEGGIPGEACSVTAFAPAEIITLEMRYVHTSSVKEELVAGCPSPVIRTTTPGESYVLVPALYHEFLHNNKPRLTPGWTPGVSTFGSISVDVGGTRIYTNDVMSFQGETACRQRLYSVRVESQVSSLVQNDDILVAFYNELAEFPFSTTTGEKTVVAVESSSHHWMTNFVRYFVDNSICSAPDPGGSILFGERLSFYSPLDNWWCEFNRHTGYLAISGAATGTEADPKTVPWVCPAFAQADSAGNWRQDQNAFLPVSHIGVEGFSPGQAPLDNCIQTGCGNWQPMVPDAQGSVAAWVLRYVCTDSPDTINFKEYVIARDNWQYAHEQPRAPIAHGECFWIYSAKTGTVLDEVITGALTNPGNYLRHPCITPDGKKVLFVAHGFFAITGFGVRFYAGMYLLDRSVPASPKLYFLNPCELRYPTRAVIASRGPALPAFQLATGKELTVNVPMGGSMPTPDIEETRMAYHIGCRRKNFGHSEGLTVLAESGVGLDLSGFYALSEEERQNVYTDHPTALRLFSTPLASTVGQSGHTAQKQTVDLLWRAAWPPSFFA